MKQDLHKTKEKDRFETQYYAACLCEYVLILGMTLQDKNCHNFWTTDQIPTKLGTDIVKALYFTYRPCMTP